VGPGGVSSPHAPGGAPGTAPASPRAVSSADRLAQLNDLRNKGLLTPEEFEAKRREVVRDL
jgi:putative oligomerization/nucleic acid binding protein